ncbi:hypothetical protein D3C78_1365410 [compost metagenome]
MLQLEHLGHRAQALERLEHQVGMQQGVDPVAVAVVDAAAPLGLAGELELEVAHLLEARQLEDLDLAAAGGQRQAKRQVGKEVAG